MTKFSIIVPIYNVEKYIEKCLVSIQKQTFTDFEVICVDDCGKDNSISIVNTFINNDSRFKLIKHVTNKGLSATRNTGIKNSTGEYLVFVDSDDWIEPILLEKLHRAFETKNVDCIWYNAKIIIEKTNTWQPLFSPKVFLLNEGYMIIKPEKIAKFPDFAWNKAYKKSIWENLDLKFEDGLFFEDAELYLKIFTNITKIYYFNTPLYNYRLRESSIVTGATGQDKKYIDMFFIIQKHYDYLIETGKFEEYKKYLLQIFLDRFRAVLIKGQHDFIIELASKTLNYINFPEKYEDLKNNN